MIKTLLIRRSILSVCRKPFDPPPGQTYRWFERHAEPLDSLADPKMAVAWKNGGEA